MTTTDAYSASDARAYMLAGNAIITLTGRETRYTYRIKQSDDGRVYFVGLLTGPDNLDSYTYLGILDADSGTIRLTRASKYTPDSGPVRAIRWATMLIWQGKDLPEPAKLYHAGRCGRCGRTLTVPDSITSGYGPECRNLLGL